MSSSIWKASYASLITNNPATKLRGSILAGILDDVGDLALWQQDAYGASAGQVLAWNGSTWAPAAAVASRSFNTIGAAAYPAGPQTTYSVSSNDTGGIIRLLPGDNTSLYPGRMIIDSSNIEAGDIFIVELVDTGQYDGYSYEIAFDDPNYLSNSGAESGIPGLPAPAVSGNYQLHTFDAHKFAGARFVITGYTAYQYDQPRRYSPPATLTDAATIQVNVHSNVRAFNISFTATGRTLQVNGLRSGESIMIVKTGAGEISTFSDDQGIGSWKKAGTAAIAWSGQDLINITRVGDTYIYSVIALQNQ